MKDNGPSHAGFHPASALDFLPLAQLRQLQLERLQAIVRRAFDNVTLFRVEGTLPHYQIIVDREKGLDTLEVQVEVTPEFFSDTVGALEGLQAKLAHSIETVTGLRAEVRLVAPRTLQRSEGKARRVLDKRKL